MKKNMGSFDRTIRILAAILVAVLYFTHTISGFWAILLGIIAIILVVTSLVNFCPLYKVLGISSCRQGKKQETINPS